MHAQEQQTSLAFPPAAPPILAPAAPAMTRPRFLGNVRAYMLRLADEMEQLPATALFGTDGAEYSAADSRASHRARAAEIRAEYADPLWMPRQLARWEMMSDSARAA